MYGSMNTSSFRFCLPWTMIRGAGIFQTDFVHLHKKQGQARVDLRLC